MFAFNSTINTTHTHLSFVPVVGSLFQTVSVAESTLDLTAEKVGSRKSPVSLKWNGDAVAICLFL